MFADVAITSKEDAIKLYNEKMQEMKDELNSMMPPVDAPPQVQRDYLTARKMEFITRTRTKVKIGWKCKAYSCIHNGPNECSKPYGGGTWIFEEREVVTKTRV